jgi:hypothetical protein
MTTYGFEKDLEDLHVWALDYMEGCDEPEWTLFSSIASAIEEYLAKRYVKGQMEFAIKDAMDKMPNALKMLEDS